MSRFAPPNFDPVARVYRWAEYLAMGPLLQRTRTAHLDKLQNCRHALLFGDGDGRFLARLLAVSPQLRATAVDTSAAMLRLLRRRCEVFASAEGARFLTLQQPALETEIPPEADLLVTHFFLDCLSQTEVEALIEKAAGTIRPGAFWLVSDFLVPSHSLRGAAWLYIRALYLAFRVFTGLRVQQLPDPQAALRLCGFRLQHRREFLFGVLYSELWVFDPSEHS